MSDNQVEPSRAKRKDKKKTPPGKTVEARERQLIALSYDVAEKQMRSGQITSQVLTHFLKMGASTAALEKEKLQHETALLKAKTNALISEKTKEELFTQAIEAFRKYSGQKGVGDDDQSDGST
jgi:hypothetical protein